MKKLRVGVVGLYSNENVGDYLLIESAKFLIKKQAADVVFRDIDVDPRDEAVYAGRRRINLRLFDIMNRYKTRVRAFAPQQLAYYYELFLWWTKVNWYYKKVIQDVDCLIVAGGGFLKFQTQGLNYLDQLILRIAKQKNIPVMFNAVGIEGYDDQDIRCRKLKNTINSGTVRFITTRDDIDTLRNNYVVNEDIVIDLVGDPAFWLPESLAIKKTTPPNKIGINLINPNNYKTYGGASSFFKIDNFYKNLIQELSLRKVDFYLFSNGMDVDQDFGQHLVSDMNLSKDRLIRKPDDSSEFLDILTDFRVILAARMHAGIAAYALDIPKVGLIWSKKIEFLANIIGERSTYFNENELDYKKIADLLCGSGAELVIDSKKRESLKKKTYSYIGKFIAEVAENGGKK